MCVYVVDGDRHVLQLANVTRYSKAIADIQRKGLTPVEILDPSGRGRVGA